MRPQIAAPKSLRDRMMLAASVLAGQATEEAEPSDGDEPISLSRLKFEKVLGFLEELQLDPIPENYRMAYEYLIAGNHRLRISVDRALDSQGRLSNDAVEEILSESEGQMSLHDLTELVAQGEQLIGAGYAAITKNGKENEGYAKALETRLDYMQGLDPAENADMPVEAQFTALLKISKQMLQSTRRAKESLKKSTEQLGAMRKRLDEANSMAQRDQLTGLPNRWAFEQQFAAATIRAKEKFEPLSVAFIDIDHFKRINDTHGHEAGDRVLQLVSQHLNDCVGGNCHLARHGGEEFVVVLENRTAQEAFEVLDGARQTLATRKLVNRESEQEIGQVTFSAGIADFDPREGNRQVLRNADAALYAAKHGGRNRICLHEAP